MPVHGPASVGDDQDVEAHDWDRRWQERTVHGHGHGEPSSVVASVLEGIVPATALDLGCGLGRNAIWLAEQGWDVTAVDFSGEALHQAREQAEQRGVDVGWVQADLRRYEPDRTFDLVLVAYVHVRRGERRDVLRRASRAVASGGLLVVVGHDLANIGTGAPGPTAPEVLYGPDDVVGDISGLAIVRAEQVRRPVDLEDGGRVEAVDALVVARAAA
jgi:SAM-dependent methyltransferase